VSLLLTRPHISGGEATLRLCPNGRYRETQPVAKCDQTASAGPMLTLVQPSLLALG